MSQGVPPASTSAIWLNTPEGGIVNAVTLPGWLLPLFATQA